MVRRFFIAVGLLLLGGCSAAERAATPGLEVTALAPGVWVHTSYKLFPSGPVGSNGLVVASDVGAVLVDTAWSPEDTAQLLDWAAREAGGVRALIVTHAHDDRMGGIVEVHARGVPSYALPATVDRAAEKGLPTIGHVLTSDAGLASLGLEGELFFPGAGHVADNGVVWLRGSGVLFGGCLVRSAAGRSLGYVEEADLDAWPGSIASLEARYPNVRHVVPGHGEPGGAELLAHTRALLATHGE